MELMSIGADYGCGSGGQQVPLPAPAGCAFLKRALSRNGAGTDCMVAATTFHDEM
jgi:hypothetical protein